MNTRFLAVMPLALLLSACASAATGASSSAPAPSAWSFRTVEASTGAERSLQDVLARVDESDVVFFGEFHDDAETHRAEALFLRAVGGLDRPVVLSLEMFERDVQSVLNDYLAGRVSEAEFLEASRPWPNYASDYRPLVELAKQNGWPVVASNVPRRLASAVGRQGMSALDSLTAAERGYAADVLQCPRGDEYHERFMATMRGHGSGGGEGADSLPTAMAERFYLAQCLKDETMAEAIVEARRRAGPDAIVVHYNGAFHSDFGLGTVNRVTRREAGWRVLVLTALPVEDPASGSVEGHERRAEFVIFTAG